MQPSRDIRNAHRRGPMSMSTQHGGGGTRRTPATKPGGKPTRGTGPDDGTGPDPTGDAEATGQTEPADDALGADDADAEGACLRPRAAAAREVKSRAAAA